MNTKDESDGINSRYNGDRDRAPTSEQIPREIPDEFI